MNSQYTKQYGNVPASGGGSPAFGEPFRFMKPTLPPLETVVARYSHAYANGLITNSAIVTEFEAAAAEYLGVKHCVAVSSCTSGLMMVLKALGLTGDVIVPSFTFFATGHAVRWNNLRPVFADCDRRTWNVDPVSVERQITDRTSAILAVHLYGNPCAIDQLQNIATRHRLKLIFDAAHGFGSKYNGRGIGRFGDAEVFSLSPTKLLVAGEGGLVTTNDHLLAQIIRAKRNYGDTGSYNPAHLGLNARMSEFNAALGLAGLTLVDDKIRRHNEIAALYTSVLEHLPGLHTQHVNGRDVNTYKDYSVHVDKRAFGLSRDALAEALTKEHIETKRYFYPPLHRQLLYQGYYEPAQTDLSTTDYISSGIISLPVYQSLPDTVVERIAFALQRISDYNRRKANNTIEKEDAYASTAA